jgi:hypothetical protein
VIDDRVKENAGEQEPSSKQDMTISKSSSESTWWQISWPQLKRLTNQRK